MSRENVEIVRRFSEAYGAEDWATTFTLLDENHELTVDPAHPHSGIYRGHAGTREFFRAWLGAFTDRSWDVDRITAVDRDVLVVGYERLRGKGSGAMVERLTAAVHTIDKGKITRTRLYSNARDALEDLDLRE